MQNNIFKNSNLIFRNMDNAPQIIPELDEDSASQEARTNLINKEKDLEALTQETKNLKKLAEERINKYKIDKKISNQQFLEFTKQLDPASNTLTPKLVEQILENLETTVEKNKTIDLANEEKNKIVSPDHPHLLELEKEYQSELKKHEKEIGTKQKKEYEEWIRQQREKTPSIAHMEEFLRKLKEKEIPPRVKAYNSLLTLCKEYELSNINDLEWTKQGLTEKTQYLSTALKAEKRIKESNELKLALPKQNKQAMQEILSARSPQEQEELLSKINKIVEKEAENFTHLRAKINTGKHSLKIMSKKEEKNFLQYYQTRPIKERLVNLNLWPQFLKEAKALSEKLAKKITEIYKDEPDNLKLALKIFEEQSFEEKKKSLKENQKLLQEKNENERKKILLIKACETAIENSDAISKKTKEKFIDFYRNEENYKNPKTGKKGDTETLEKYYKTLVSKTPDFEARNLKAYEHYLERHNARIQELKDLDPSISEKEVKEWRESYMNAGWTERKKIHLKLLKKIEEKSKKTEEISEEESTNIETVEMTKLELIKHLDKLTDSKKFAEAMILLMQYLINNPKDKDDEEIIKYKKFIDAAIDLKGPGEALNEKEKAEIEKAVKEEVKTTNTKKELQEQQLKTLKIKGMKKNSKAKTEEEKAKSESIQTSSDTIEQNLIDDFYKNEPDYILNEEGEASVKSEIQFSEEGMEEEEISALKKALRPQQQKIDKKKEIRGIEIKNKQGEELTYEQARDKQQKELDELYEETAKNAMEKTEHSKNAQGLNHESSAALFAAQIAAKRAAQQKIDEERNKKLGST